MKIFGFDIEFDHNELRRKIESSSKRDTKGYICVVDGPSLARSYKNAAFLTLLQQSYANTCDGGSVAFMANRLTKRNLKAFTGPEIFAEYVVNPTYKQVLLGNTDEKYKMISEKVAKEVGNTDYLYHVPLPFASIDEFDYEGIARKIDSIDADIIWVSLGAPKQEIWMAAHENKISGLMIGVGAAFDYESGNIKRAPKWMQKLNLEWLYRLLQDPKRLLPRYIKTNSKFLIWKYKDGRK